MALRDLVKLPLPPDTALLVLTIVGCFFVLPSPLWVFWFVIYFVLSLQYVHYLQKKYSLSSFNLLGHTAPAQASSLLVLGPFLDYWLTGKRIDAFNYTLPSVVRIDSVMVVIILALHAPHTCGLAVVIINVCPMLLSLGIGCKCATWWGDWSFLKLLHVFVLEGSQVYVPNTHVKSRRSRMCVWVEMNCPSNITKYPDSLHAIIHCQCI